MPDPGQLAEAIISATLIAAGLITYYIAPRRGRGTLGFRVGPAYASEEVWARINREAGAALTATGAALMALAAAGTPPPIFTAVAVAALLAEAAALTVRAKKLAEAETMREGGEGEEPKPIKSWVGWWRAAAAAAPLVITVALTIAYWGSLPAEVPIHFDAGGAPDSYVDEWMFKSVITPMYLLMSGAGLAYALGTRHPLIGYRPWGRPGESAKVISDVITLLSYAAAYSYADTLHYAVSGAHIAPPAVLFLFPAAALARALVWARMRGVI